MNARQQPQIDDLIQGALEEDIQAGDVTTNAIFDSEAHAGAVWTAKQDGIVAGLAIARRVFERLDHHVEWIPKAEEGAKVAAGQQLLLVKGQTRALLTAERLALNFAQRLSGIATKTEQFVSAVKPWKAEIYDTRKTVPGLRKLDKYAVRCGGGCNHRMGLYDMALIKDNHIAGAGSIAKAVAAVRRNHPDLTIEVETATLQQLDEAVAAAADIIMLDNMNCEQMRQAVQTIDGRARTEASGNVTLKTVADIAQTGVDAISVGALTHSVEAFDISQTLYT